VKKYLCSCLLFLAASAFAPGETKSDSEPPAVALTNVTIIDTTGKHPGGRATVLIRGDRISEIGQPDAIQVPAGAQIVDGAGKFLMPGLWDMHMHLSYVSQSAFPLLIANGVTGVCDMGGDLDQIDRWRNEIKDRTRLGPRIVRAGPVLDGPRTEEGKYRLTVNNADEGRKAVRSLKARGVDFIKVYHFLSRDSYFAIADEARKQRIAFDGHIPNGISPQEASDAGQRRLEHTTVLLQSTMSLQKKEGRTSKELTAQAFDILLGAEGAAWFRTMAKNGTWHTPTLVLARSFLLRAELAAKSDDRRKYVAPVVKEHWEKNNPVPKNVSEQDMSDRRQALQKMVEVVRSMHTAGVQMLAGTDPPTRDVFPGFSLHDELGLLVNAGLTPLEAIQAATLNAAKCLGLSDSYGTVEKGKVADLLLLDADPLATIANTQKIAAVVVAGKFLPKAALQEMLAQTEAAVKRK
jgi:imidazolonepropionase-like amidohydrolase